MRRLSFILSILSCFSLQAQMGRIPMNVFIPEDVFDAEAISMLDSKLNQIVTNYAVADNSADYRFFMTPTIIVSSKTIVPSAPPKVSQKLELVLFIGDVIDDKLFGSLSIPLIGVGQNDTMAYLNALKRRKTRLSPTISRMPILLLVVQKALRNPVSMMRRSALLSPSRTFAARSVRMLGKLLSGSIR